MSRHNKGSFTKRSILLAAGIAAIAVVAGCNRGGGGSEGNGGGGGGEGAAQRQPGLWESVTTVRSIDLPGAPPELLGQIRAQVGQAQTQRECLTAEQAGHPLAQVHRMLSEGNNGRCDFTDEVFAGGTIRIRGTCHRAEGGTTQLSLEGTFTETTIEANLTMNVQGPASAAAPGATSVNMALEVHGRWLGDCPAEAPAAGNTM